MSQRKLTDQRRWKRKTDQEKHAYILRRYRMSPAQYQRHLDEQEDCCAICGRPPMAGKNLEVDHCHTTGAIRGLLCDSCNRALGLFGESASRLREAANYLEGKEDIVGG